MPLQSGLIVSVLPTLIVSASLSVLVPRTLITYDNSREVVLRGRVGCLDRAGKRSSNESSCVEPHRFAIETSDGKLFRFRESDVMTEMFTDPRVRQQNLQIQSRQHDDQDLEIIKVQAIKEGKLYDIYYFCQVCNITSYVPGPCPCCRAEMVFTESPAQAP